MAIDQTLLDRAAQRASGGSGCTGGSRTVSRSAGTSRRPGATTPGGSRRWAWTRCGGRRAGAPCGTARELTYAVACPAERLGSLRESYLEIHAMLRDALAQLGVAGRPRAAGPGGKRSTPGPASPSRPAARSWWRAEGGGECAAPTAGMPCSSTDRSCSRTIRRTVGAADPGRRAARPAGPLAFDAGRATSTAADLIGRCRDAAAAHWPGGWRAVDTGPG